MSLTNTSFNMNSTLTLLRKWCLAGC